MDTIACRRDPNDKDAMVHVLDLRPRLNQVEMKEESEWSSKQFDSHNRMNDKQAKEFLLDSLESSLQKEIDDKSDEDDTFVDSPFHLIEDERPATMNSEKHCLMLSKPCLRASSPTKMSKAVCPPSDH